MSRLLRLGWAVVGGLLLGGWDHSDRLQESAMAPPIEPFQGGVFDLVESPPGPGVFLGGGGGI
ncbi:MAG: hypothetical protein ACT4OP_05710 [Actinomycetota bacterium]